ncbi:stage II sporulation protein B [Bacillus methanolicus]|uniref:stage II sporulation protein B n=1 Tax=Bacillus methanolicus TaxID=1471 RepID=UPI00238044D5|nr:stage II sporulation protein B [Bacillus methanolicus]MDE3839772.1 stage II sporulation protein B [Bacillus methanolicus]
MDKREKGQTITIKINGKDRPFKEAHSEDAEIEKKTGYNNRLDKDEYVTRNETAAAEESLEESFDWILPELSDEPKVAEKKIADETIKNKNKGWSGNANQKNNSSRGIFTSIFFSIFLAILLGVSFGLIILKPVISDNTAEEIEEPIPSADEAKPAGGTASVNVPPISAFIVQEGVYSTSEAAEKAKSAVEQKGAPVHIVNLNGKFFVYLSVADSMENAKEIGSGLKKDEINVFAKPLDFGGKQLSGVQETERKLLESAPPLYETLAKAASEASLTNSVSKETAESLNNQGKAILQIEETALKNKNVKKVRSNLVNAIEKANAIQKSPEQETAKELQNELLSFLAAYQSL